MHVGAAALCWALWLSRNEVIVKQRVPNSFAQVIFRGMHWIRSWSQMSKEEEERTLKTICHRLEVIAMEILKGISWS